MIKKRIVCSANPQSVAAQQHSLISSLSLTQQQQQQQSARIADYFSCFHLNKTSRMHILIFAPLRTFYFSAIAHTIQEHFFFVKRKERRRRDSYFVLIKIPRRRQSEKVKRPRHKHTQQFIK